MKGGSSEKQAKWKYVAHDQLLVESLWTSTLPPKGNFMHDINSMENPDTSFVKCFYIQANARKY